MSCRDDLTSAEQDVKAVEALIYKLSTDSQARVHVIANILRDLINAPEGGYEAELAFTLVLAERAMS